MLPSQRPLFDIPADVAYLDGAAFSPVPHSVHAAGTEGLAVKSRPWRGGRPETERWCERARAAAASLIGARPRDVAVVSSVAQGMATAARNLPLPAGARILRVQDEFPSVALAWDHLARAQGLSVEIVPRPADADWTRAVLGALERPGAPPLAVATLTPLHWSDGARIDLDVLAPVVHRLGGALVIDATQAAGVLPIKLDVWRPDFLAFPTYKWVLGPYSLGFLYAAPHRQDGTPTEQHNGNHGPDGRLLPDARRYDKGERNDPTALPMAATGLELVQSWGQAAIAARLRALTGLLAEGVTRLGLSVLPEALRAPHILGVRFPGGIPAGLIEKLEADGVFVCDRLGVMRVSPHVWAEEADVSRFLAALEKRLGD